ncbi:hypothetical protein RW1_024_00240 [Rhodococcus wratislaviensis NBRC 100605]|uniref:Uncharacterized protein n=2 Tax=Rhodococcus TaxID=1827 RepID=X0Q532_RHOWR|nr:hypothetical protein EP51_04045 [Rhodococcus opacus]GAF45661.1 hypothetical protein RW1_024_00240 [Rhodococcus wratislaviensis NBRC 100605]
MDRQPTVHTDASVLDRRGLDQLIEALRARSYCVVGPTVEEASRIIDRYVRPAEPFTAGPPIHTVGHGVSEAPRGLLYQRYEFDPTGSIRAAIIIPPTSQNQAAIEHDLRRAVDGNLMLADDDLTTLCERTIRNYYPYISCATHFLTLTVDRR